MSYLADESDGIAQIVGAYIVDHNEHSGNVSDIYAVPCCVVYREHCHRNERCVPVLLHDNFRNLFDFILVSWWLRC